MADIAPGSVANGGPAPTAAALFAVLWKALAEVLGTAATAAIVRRAVQRAAAKHADFADLADLVVARADLRYSYTLPAIWSQPAERGALALRGLAAEIGHLLAELTGTVVIRLLEQIPELRAAGITWRSEGAN